MKIFQNCVLLIAVLSPLILNASIPKLCILLENETILDKIENGVWNVEYSVCKHSFEKIPVFEEAIAIDKAKKYLRNKLPWNKYKKLKLTSCKLRKYDPELNKLNWKYHQADLSGIWWYKVEFTLVDSEEEVLPVVIFQDGSIIKAGYKNLDPILL